LLKAIAVIMSSWLILSDGCSSPKTCVNFHSVSYSYIYK